MVALLAAVTTGLAITQAIRGAQALRATDAVVFQSAGRIVGAHGCVYCLEPQRLAQMTLLGGQLQGNGVEPFSNPPLVAWVVQPVAGLTLPIYTLLSVLLEAVALVAAVIMARRLLTGSRSTLLPIPVIVLALVLPLPGLETLAFAQWDGLMLAALLGAYLLTRADHGFAAGLALSFLLIKPQDVWLVPLALAIARAWPALRGFALGAGAWLLTSFAVVSVGTLTHITDSLGQNQSQVQFTDGLPGIAAAIAGPGWGFVIAGMGIAAVLGLWPWRDRLHLDPMLTLDVGITLSLLFSPHFFSADLVLIGAVLIDIGRRSVPTAVAGALLLDAAYLVEGPLLHTQGHVQALALLGVAALVVSVIVAKPRQQRMPIGLPVAAGYHGPAVTFWKRPEN